MTHQDIINRLRQMDDRLHANEQTTARHKVMLEGDRLASPAVPGLFAMSEGVVDKIEDPERGNLALHRRTKRLEIVFYIGVGVYLTVKALVWGAGQLWPLLPK